jgi:hypothetical protein
MDETEDATTFVSNAEIEINHVLGLFDVPAFARRGKELEYALTRLSQRLAREREGMLDMVRVRLRAWSSVATGPDDWREVFAEPVAPLWSLARLDPPNWSSRPAPSRRRKTIARDLASSVARFNRRWAEFLEGLDLGPVNHRIDQYNRYYVFEKECVMGSARLAARHFVPKTPVSPESVLADFPLLPVPSLSS